jgi:hypothetical protein
MRINDDPMHPAGEPILLRQAPRCGARTRKGAACQSPAVRGKTRCRMHGGARGSGGPIGERNGNYRHGHYTKQRIATMQAARKLIGQARGLVSDQIRSAPGAFGSRADMPVAKLSKCRAD